MNQLRRLLDSLSVRQRISIVAAVLSVIALLFAVARWNTERDFKPLFSNLSAEDAGAVVARLKETGTEFRLSRDGGTVLAPSAKVAELRLQLAAAGLPKSGRAGFELFDKTNLAASEFAEQVNYHRALEGELERSIISLREVEQARVHITLAKESLYTESRQPAKASILLKLRPGARLAASSVQAICHLTASAVPGLAPEAVSVVDTAGELLNRPRRVLADGGGETSDAMLDYRKSVERDIQSKVAATLEPILGEGKFRVGVSADCDFSTAEQSEEVFDPSKSVMVSSQRTEDGPGTVTSSGVPGTASNLPRPTSTPAKSSGGYVRRTENIAYQSSRLVKRVKLPQGSVKKISLSVLLDHSVRIEGSGDKAKRIVEAPKPEKLKIVRDLAAAAAGFQQDRGDLIVVESFPFESTLHAEPPAERTGPAPAPPPFAWAPAWLRSLLETRSAPVLLGIGAGCALALIVGLALLLRRKPSPAKGKVTATGELATAGGAAATASRALTDQDVQRQIEAKLAEREAERAKMTAEALAALQLPNVSTKKTEVLIRHIGDEAKKNPGAMAQVVRSWLNAESH